MRHSFTPVTFLRRNTGSVGMDPTIDYYRRQAARCEDWAETASNPDIRAEYKRLALAWLSLANFRHNTSLPATQPESPVTRITR
jgi:hypothetical protein